ncbi:MAG: hypothetical protein PHE48_03410 [Candidatus Daviesbacteria bacterium]|nr:hypothetical protein [Candidatus Daviesbacteria bacterium]
MDDLTERQEFAQRITEELKRQWQFWHNLVEIKGEEDDMPDTKEYQFVIDRRTEDESLFTADSVTILSLGNIPLEDWTRTIPELTTRANEEWIQITVDPKNPYNTKLGIYSGEDVFLSGKKNDFYYTEVLDVFLSNQGRAFEHTTWDWVAIPSSYPSQYEHRSYLKRCPTPEEIQVTFTTEPEEEYTEPFQPLKGFSLERLGFLVMKVKMGEIIEPPSQ